MRLVHSIQFDKGERRLIRDLALPNFGVGITDEDLRDERRRNLMYVSSGDAVPRAKVTEAWNTVLMAEAACREQSAPEWWEKQLGVGGLPRAFGEAEQKGETVTLVINPIQFCKDMAANRLGQARALREVGELFCAALDACPEVAEDGEY